MRKPTELEVATVGLLRDAFPEPWTISLDRLFPGDWRATAMLPGVSVLGLGSSPVDAVEGAIKNWNAAKRSF